MIASPAILIPEVLSITCFADNAAWVDALVLVTLKMLLKNDIHLVVGPSDSSGGIWVTKSEMEIQAESEANDFVMDYMPLTAFSGEIIISPMDAARLDAAVEAYNLYNRAISYPQDYPVHLQAAIKKLQQLAPTRLTIDATADGVGADAVRIKTESLAI